MWPMNKLEKRINPQDLHKESSLRRREYQLLLLSILIILFLTLSIIVTNLLESVIKESNYIEGSINLSFYMNSLAILILLFTFYLLLKQREIQRLRLALSGEENYVKYLEQHMKVMTSIFEISTEINSQMNVDKILQVIVQRVTECLDADYSSLLLVQEDKHLKTQAAYGKGAECAENALLSIGESVDGWVVQHGKPLLLNGEVGLETFPGLQKKEQRVYSSLCVPLTAEDKTLGVLNVNRTETIKSFTQKDLQLLSIFGNHAAVAIEGARLLKESQEKARLRAIFGQYHSPDVVDEILKYPSSQRLAEEKILTVMFADIRGFSQVTRFLNTSQIKDFLDVFYSSMTKIIFDHKGTVDKFIGDAVMAFFGAPLSLKDPEYQCLVAAQEMIENFDKLKVKWVAEFPQLQSIGLGIGINTDKVFIGSVGSLYRYDYTVIGEGVVVAERLSKMAKPGQILVSEKTYSAEKSYCEFKPVSQMDYMGIQDPINVYEVALIN